jgi:hypothetical protein
MQHNATQSNTTQRNTTQRNTTQHNTTQHKVNFRDAEFFFLFFNLCEVLLQASVKALQITGTNLIRKI